MMSAAGAVVAAGSASVVIFIVVVIIRIIRVIWIIRVVWVIWIIRIGLLVDREVRFCSTVVKQCFDGVRSYRQCIKICCLECEHNAAAYGCVFI